MTHWKRPYSKLVYRLTRLQSFHLSYIEFGGKERAPLTFMRESVCFCFGLRFGRKKNYFSHSSAGNAWAPYLPHLIQMRRMVEVPLLGDHMLLCLLPLLGLEPTTLANEMRKYPVFPFLRFMLPCPQRKGFFHIPFLMKLLQPSYRLVQIILFHLPQTDPSLDLLLLS